MKLASLIILLASVQTKQLRRLIYDDEGNYAMVDANGINESDLMSGAHWRKSWPEGVDDGSGDADVLDFGTTRKPPRVPEPAKPLPA